MPAALGNASFLYIFHRTLHATGMIRASNFHRHIAYKCVDVDIGFSVLINYGTQHTKVRSAAGARLSCLRVTAPVMLKSFHSNFLLAVGDWAEGKILCEHFGRRQHFELITTVRLLQETRDCRILSWVKLFSERSIVVGIHLFPNQLAQRGQ